tara:strand:+ start:320 stop:1372 length:1053 start_codon:yes stop_codon:yes gene_type:complete
MTLWGNNDNLTSAGTVSLDYTSGIGTGSGTAFGAVGTGVTGDIIRFGFRGAEGTYFGDAVIQDVGSATSITIGSTAGLKSLAAGGFAATSYYLSELPKSSVLDHTYSNARDTVPGFENYTTGDALDSAGTGQPNVGVNFGILNPPLSIGAGQDSLFNNNTQIKVAGLGTATTAAVQGSAVGFSTLFVDTAKLPGLAGGDSVDVQVGGIPVSATISSVGSTSVSLASTISTLVSASDVLLFRSDNIISLASNVAAAISNGDELIFQRYKGGYDTNIYGISGATSQTFTADPGTDDSKSKFRTEGSGWVGVSTYIDCHGNLRVKSEILVAMGGTSGVGIQTGSNGIEYPTGV